MIESADPCSVRGHLAVRTTPSRAPPNPPLAAKFSRKMVGLVGFRSPDVGPTFVYVGFVPANAAPSRPLKLSKNIKFLAVFCKNQLKTNHYPP